MEKIKSWKTQSVKHKVALVLIADGVSFSYTETDGRLVPETNGMSAFTPTCGQTGSKRAQRAQIVDELK